MTALSVLQPLSNINDTHIITDSPVPASHTLTDDVASHDPLPPPTTAADSSSSSSRPQSRKGTQPWPEHRSRNNRLSFATIARDKTTTALTNLAVRTRNSTTSLRSQSPVRHTKQASVGYFTPLAVQQTRTHTSSLSQTSLDTLHSSISDVTTRSGGAILGGGTLDRLTSDRGETDRRRLLERTPSPSSAGGSLRSAPSQNSMHQTSSRLLRMTDEERPFTRDFNDLFSTLIVSLPLTPHRVRFQKMEHTFTSEEAINNLGSLKFSQSNRMPDPKDPSRIVTTTTTTTFSMAKEMARSVCQRFMDARFIEPADGKPVPAFTLKGAVWQLTPKGMSVLTRFCQRNGINQRHVLDVLDSQRNIMQLVILERDVTSDKLSHDRATIEVIFRRFAGQDGPNLKANTSTSDSDSVSDYYNGLIGVKMAEKRRVGDRMVLNTFTGKAAVDWLMDCCTTVDRREAYEVAELFITCGLIWPAQEDKLFAHQNPHAGRFQPTKIAIYELSEKGKIVAGWKSRENSPVDENRIDAASSKSANARPDGRAGPRDSNNNRLTVIVNDAALRLLFREFLCDTHCEENLSFYLEVREFTKNYDNAEKAKAFSRLDAIRENLAAAYGESHFVIVHASVLMPFRSIQCFPSTGVTLRAEYRPQPAQQLSCTDDTGCRG